MKKRTALEKARNVERLDGNQLRTRETRALLLKAAEKIFVRDGFEKADLNEIASAAGRTKGAIYAHFKSKEELFVALFEQRTRDCATRFDEMLADSKNLKQNRLILRDLMLSVLDDKAWLLLLLEFKLYAVRNPKSKNRLRALYKSTYSPESAGYAALFGRDTEKVPAIVLLLPILSAVAVEKQFAPDLLGDAVLKDAVSRVFGALVG
ncbi:MAG TPA: helix-turn-helix domain-containing protein [Candidatus Binatia bacterium]|nr:helix-turn-helix domain-containing protein [Candidatus Binatia bacterium]